MVFLTSSSVFSGGDKHLVNLIRRLDPARVQARVLCFGADTYSRVLNQQLGLGIGVQTGFGLQRPVHAWRALRRERAEVVVVITGEVGAFPSPLFVAARLSGARRVHAIYHNVSAPAPPPGRGAAACATGRGAPWAIAPGRRRTAGWRRP